MYELACPHCAARRPLGRTEMLQLLRARGGLRRAEDPEMDVIVQLLQAQLPQLTCEACGQHGQQLQTAADDFADADWGEGKACARCGQKIAAERLELFPQTTLCPKCQRLAEQGDTGEAAEYCPRCGNVMQLAKTRGAGIARYVMRCPACG